ncbi:ASCH domain-containing protein [Iocasia frigidifontis]|uniref:ASCH domain-containing protein n=1 Tax=Iocasia fonsfrigidae TaxID=2682810 RepID=UPI001E4B8C71|nr:ASCH domain-containing protein [Iocasia fonsfrigidae]
MEHNMKLFEEPFELIAQRKKVIEIRLNDTKRQKVKIGDYITFLKLPECEETIKVRVVGLLHYQSFEKLYKDIPFILFGREEKSLEWMIKGTYDI